jgi:hypothetical protein
VGDRADEIADKLFTFLDDNISDRSGVGDEWSRIDVTTHDEIRAKWAARFAAALRDAVAQERAECAATIRAAEPLSPTPETLTLIEGLATIIEMRGEPDPGPGLRVIKGGRDV